MNTAMEGSICRGSVVRVFNCAARGYEDADIVSARSGEELIERLDVLSFEPNSVADIGAGAGRHTRALLKRYPRARVHRIDPATKMLDQFKLRPIERLRHGRRVAQSTQSAEATGLGPAAVDMVFANQCLQYCDIEAAFTEFARVLRPGGFLSFATIGPDTFEQLHHAWESTGLSGAALESRLHRFVDMHDIGDQLVRAGFVDPVLDTDILSLSYPSAAALFAELRAAGARNLREDRPQHFTGRRRFERFVRALEARRNQDQRIELTIELVYGHAWAPQPRPARVPGSIPVTLGPQPGSG